MLSEGIGVLLEMSEVFFLFHLLFFSPTPVESCKDVMLLHFSSHHVSSPFLTRSCHDAIHCDVM